MPEYGADWLLHPVDPARLLSRHCDGHFLHVDRGISGYYDEVFSRARLEQIVDQGSDRLFGLVYASAEGVMEDLPVEVEEGALDWANRRLEAGKTVVVNAISQLCPEVGLLCARVGRFLGAPVHANGYLTPAGCPGHPVHFDTDDTVFLQIEGSKNWALYPGPIDLPLASQFIPLDTASLGEPIAEITLAAGDLLYVPRGVVHVAVAGSQDSLHLTLGLHHRLWRDHFLELAEQAALDSELLRRAVSLGPDDLPDRVLRDEVLRHFRRVIESAALEPGDGGSRGRRRGPSA